MKKLAFIACGLVLASQVNAQLANDSGVNALVSPVSPVLANSGRPVTVTIKNFGTSALTAATLGFSVNGVVQPTYTWSGNLAANAVSGGITIGNFTFTPGTHTVKAWSKSPNNLTDGDAANDTTTITVRTCSAMSGSYTINKNAAASATNFTSFVDAALALGNCGVSGPVTIMVAPNSGPYAEQMVLPAIAGTSATNTVIIEGSGNTLSGATTTAKPGLISFNGADFVKVNNLKLEVQASSPAGYGVHLLNASDNNAITNCNITVPLTATSDQYNGIVAGLPTYATGNYANNLLVQNNTINGGYFCVLLNGAATITSGNRIIGNQIRNPHTYSIALSNAGTGTIIEGNDISRPTRVNGTIMYGVFMTGATTNTTVSKNRIHNTHDVAGNTSGTVYGIYTNAAPTVGSENIIKNNILYNVNNTGGSYFALYNTDGSNTWYYHNTISGNNSAAVSYLRGLHVTGNAINVKFFNNVVSLPGTATTKHAIYVGTTTVVLASNNNDLYIGGSGNIGFYSADKPTFNDWKAANGGAFDQSSVSVDPVFANTSNLQPLNPAVNNAGQALTAVTEDINGVTRSTTTPDPGAYEFTPVTTDAGVTAITAPTSPVTPGSQAVQVTLRNFGTGSLSTAKIGWSVNGAVQPDYNWNGSLNGLQTAAALNIGSYNFTGGNYTIKAWAKNPNGATDMLAANDTTVLRVISCAPLAGSYTINKNNPTAGTNFQTFAEATARLSSCGVSGPVTLSVASGTGPYAEQVEIGNIPYTSATNTVTFEGSGNTVSTTPVGKQGIFILNGAQYVKLNNFVITVPSSAAMGWGVQLLNAADNNTVSNNTINVPLTSTAMDVNGICTGNTTTIAGNHTSNSKFQNNIINGGYHGIRLNGNTGGINAANNQITGNQFRDNYSYGVYVSNASGTLIEGNDLSRPTRTNTSTYFGINLASGTCQSTIISKNRIHNTHDGMPGGGGTVYGIYINGSAPAGNENIIKNNLIYNLNNGSGTTFGMVNAGGNGSYFYHNSVASDPAKTYASLRGISFNTAVSNVKFINNILSLPSTATSKYAVYVAQATTSLLSENNDLFIGNNGFVGFFGVDKPTMADWKLAGSGSFDLVSVATDPIFASLATGDLKPTSPSADNLGQAGTTVTDDILGAVRNVTTPDIGAFEFGAAGTDVSIESVSGPNLATCNFPANDSVSVVIKNLGTTTQTSIPVSYKVNNNAPVNETWTGTLAPSASATYTFQTKVSLTTPGAYTISARTMLTGDAVAANDSDTLRVMNAMIPGMPVSLNFETAANGIAKFRKVTNFKSNITESTAASFGAGSTKGLIMDGVNNPAWVSPAGQANPWTSNPDNFAGAYFCVSPAGGAATDSLYLTFDLKQLYKTANVNTNFRVTVNGAQVGPTYRPPFSGTPINWQKVKVDLTTFKNQPTIQIGLESSVKEAYANGTGTANLVDNIKVERVALVKGVKENALAANLKVFPNPSNGSFNVSLQNGRDYTLKVTDLSGKTILKQTAKGDAKLNLEGAAKGIYLLHVSSENGTAVRKLIVE